MKRIVCYILLLFCTLSLSAYGQDKSLFTLPESAEIIDLGSYSDMFTAGDDWDTRQTTDAYRPADWAWGGFSQRCVLQIYIGDSHDCLGRNDDSRIGGSLLYGRGPGYKVSDSYIIDF